MAARAGMSRRDFWDWELELDELFIYAEEREKLEWEKVSATANAQQEIQLEIAAIQTAWVLNAFGANTTASKLLGREKTEKPKATTRSEYEQLKQRLGGE